MRKFIIAAIAAMLAVCTISAQENQVRRLPQVGKKPVGTTEYTSNAIGFWMATELSAAYSCRLFNSNFGLTELDAVVGYRFNDYLRMGLGIGARYYFDNAKVRYDSSEWAFPLYLNMRGNFIPATYRSVTPYYSIDLGGTIRDGLMLRPTVGIRVGQERSAFLLGLGYLGQDLKSFAWDTEKGYVSKRKFVSFITLKLGYEF